MTKERKLLEEMDRDIEWMEEVLSNSEGNLVCFRANEKEGILPHQIADGSLLFVKCGASYSKGDFILIKDKRMRKDGIRIVKAVSKREEKYFGKLILAVKRFDMGV